MEATLLDDEDTRSYEEEVPPTPQTASHARIWLAVLRVYMYLTGGLFCTQSIYTGVCMHILAGGTGYI